MAIQSTALLTNAGVGVNGSAFPMVHGRKVGLIASGTFSGTTVKVQGSLDGSAWFDVPTASFTAAGVLSIELPVPFVRGVTVAGTGSGLNLTLTQANALD